MNHPPDKVCAVCGRRIEWRKKWARNWGEVKYCSDRCRGARMKSGSAGKFETEILELLEKRGSGKTICPSELLDEEGKQNQAKMEEVRQAARRLVAKGKIEITQKGHVVDPSDFRGPIRLRLKK